MGREGLAGEQEGTHELAGFPNTTACQQSRDPPRARAGDQHGSRQEGVQWNQKYAGLCQTRPRTLSRLEGHNRIVTQKHPV